MLGKATSICWYLWHCMVLHGWLHPMGVQVQLLHNQGTQSFSWLYGWDLTCFWMRMYPLANCLSFISVVISLSYQSHYFSALFLTINWRSPVTWHHGSVNVNATGCSQPPIPADLIFTWKILKIINHSSTLITCSCLDTFQIEGMVLFHPLGVTLCPVVALAFDWLVSEESWVHCCKLQWNKFGPAKINDTKQISMCLWTLGFVLPLDVEFFVNNNIVGWKVTMNKHMWRGVKLGYPVILYELHLLLALNHCATRKLANLSTTNLAVDFGFDPVECSLF